MSEPLSISSISSEKFLNAIDRPSDRSGRSLKKSGGPTNSFDGQSIEESVFNEFTDEFVVNVQDGGKKNDATENVDTIDIDDIMFSPPLEFSDLDSFESETQ